MHFNKYTIVEILFPIITLYWIYSYFSIAGIGALYLCTLLLHTHVTIFMHRAFSHRAWIPNKALTIWGLFVCTIGITGNSPAWCAVHREHHRYADTDKDPHNPNTTPWWRLLFWQNLKPNLDYSKDILGDPVHGWFYQRFWRIVFAWMLVLLLISPSALFFWCAVVGFNRFLMNLMNIIGHSKGEPVNSPVFAYLYLQGEPWHGNHHNNQKDWRLGKTWWQVDLGAWLIRIFVALNLAKAR